MRRPAHKRRSWSRKLMLIAAGILVLAVIVVPTTQAFAATGSTAVGPSLSMASSCPSYVIVGARGSGQPDETSGKFRGLGPEVDKMATVLQQVLGKKHFSTAYKAINYTAAPVSVLRPTAAQLKLFLKNPSAALADWYENNVKKFMASIADGVAKTVAYAESKTKECRAVNTALILVGYSQGAMAVHEAELQLKKAEGKGTSFAFGRIGGTLLLSDGYRVKETIAKQFGTAKPGGQGVATVLRHGVGDLPDPGPSPANVCDANDVVCDFSARLFLRIANLLAVHTSYAKCNAKDQCTYKPVLTTAANWVADGALP